MQTIDTHYKALYEQEYARRMVAEHELAYIQDIFRRSDLTGNEVKVLVIARQTARQLADRQGADPYSQVWDIYLPRLSSQAGVSEDTAGKILRKFNAAHILAYTSTRDDEQRRHAHLQLLPCLESVATIPPLDKQWGGTRTKYCKSCGSDNLVRKTQIVCADCGQVCHGSCTPINKPELEDPNRKLHLTVEDEDQDLDLPTTCTSNAYTSPPACQPQVAASSQLKGGSGDICIKRAAKYLMGLQPVNAEQYIRMCTHNEYLDNRKYTTVKPDRSYSQEDVERHLSGEHTIGIFAYKQLPNKTLFLAYDEDNAEKWQAMQSYGPAFLAAGLQPIYEHSPAVVEHVGGGRLWIMFDLPVDFYSAQQFVGSMAPMLLDCLEQWPNTGRNVRLPGGKYIFGVEAWTRYTNGMGQLLATDGLSFAAMLFDHLTPASIIPLLEKPAPVVE